MDVLDARERALTVTTRLRNLWAGPGSGKVRAAIPLETLLLLPPFKMYGRKAKMSLTRDSTPS